MSYNTGATRVNTFGLPLILVRICWGVSAAKYPRPHFTVLLYLLEHGISNFVIFDNLGSDHS